MQIKKHNNTSLLAIVLVINNLENLYRPLNKGLDLDKNPPEKKSCGMCWFWANLKSWGKTIFCILLKK